jgi:hypothetical protein
MLSTTSSDCEMENNNNFKLTKLNKYETIELEDMSTEITKDDIKNFLISSKYNNLFFSVNSRNYKS